MFILKHLTVERFRLLREVNLHFPQRGSILIQGPNEAGKSTLFESIYFALYGEPLASLREGRSFDDLILYGATTASVILTFSVGAQELTIARTLERGQGQQVALQIRSLGLPDEEPITDIETANQRIISTLNDLDGKTLRNSSFIEQKGLTRLEVLSGTEREATLRKLLGLEDMARVASKFTLADEDEQLLARAIERFKLAEIQSRLPELSAALAEAETSLDALTIVEDLDEMQQQEVDIADQVRLTEQLQRKRHILKSRQQRLQQLKKADLVLSEIIDAYDAIAEAQREIPDLERQIADLERHEREELPALEKRVQDLGDLIRSFGTLERMASDLLDSVNSIKDLEKGVREYDEFKSMLEALDEQVSSERHNIDEMTQAQHEIEDNHKRQQPRIANRLAHLKIISARLKALHRLEDLYGQGIMHQGLAEENSSQIKKVLKDIKETEQDLAQTEKDSKDVLKQSEELDERWRKVCIRRQLEDWQRLKGLSQNLAAAEQKVRSAHEQQGQLGLRVEEARKKMMINGVLTVALAVIAIVLLVGAVALFSSGNSLIGFVLIMLALILIGGAAWAAQQTRLANKRKKEVDQEYNNGQNQVSTMVAAREAAVRMGGSHETLARAENEIRALGGTVPNTVDEGQRVMESLPEPASDQSIAELQEQMHDLRTRTAEARNQINAKKETVVALRKEWGRLDEQRRKEGWNEIEARLRNNKNGLKKAQDEIRSLASSEGLPVPSFNTSNSGILASSSEFETLIEAAIQDAERELVTLSSRLEAIAELQAQSKVHEDALDTLLVRKQAAIERQEEYELHNPHKKIAEERERQAALREALRNLQDSLRERVKPLGVSFGQAAISSAEAAARKQLESMHIMLGRRVGLESRHSIYGATLRERQGSLAEHYKQLSKYSSSIGSWVVPLNPFAEALVGLRTRCQNEIQEANEQEIAQELESLQQQEGALNAKMALCNQEILDAYERISTMLAQHNRPPVKNFIQSELAVSWPLIEQFTPDDRSRLEEEHDRFEQDLRDLEQEELELSSQLQMTGELLDLDEARQQMEAQEHNYQVKKHSVSMIEALNQRMMQKMMPRTEHYMQQLLPLLTSGRYHDVKLGTDDKGALQMQIWESAANEYVVTSTVSGGTSDQLSLTLRLAFAVAALPRDLTAAPGFLMLDEPLSAFDRGRTRALVDVITGEMLGQHFEQVFFISHSNTFEAGMFPYHIYMDNGIVVDSNLPVVSTLSLAESNGTYLSDDAEQDVPTIPQTDPLPAIVSVEQA